MKLSVIFINHNSRNGLRLALNTLFRVKGSTPFEVIVFDNASTDRSIEMLSFEFPKVRIIASTSYIGFSKAYNTTIHAASGAYVLLLSPYVLATGDSLDKLVNFMDQHPLTAGASIRMVDYKGDYLPESKHSLSKGWATLLRLAGMSSYFPKSIQDHKRTDWVEEFETSEIDVLNAHCMLLRRSAVEK